MSFLNRRQTLSAVAALGATAAASKAASKSDNDFVSVKDNRLMLNGKPYFYVGANIWYGAYLGADAAYGNRPRLARELDRLKALGITNLRVLASSELSPLNNSLDPAFSDKGNKYNDTLLGGLDYLLAEMASRDMKAVLYLTNFWEWSGGITTYQYYLTGKYINMNDPAHPWPEFADQSSQFYKSKEAIKLYHAYVTMILGRTNSITGVAYKDDSTIMAWQLCNEPRPAGDNAKYEAMRKPYMAWIKETSALIRSLSPKHLVSLGHEGVMGCNGRTDCVYEAHHSIDYFTAHIWPQNWGWVDPKNLKGTFARGEELSRQYLNTSADIARVANKPLVIEEFGFPRDEGYEPGTSTVYKDRFYKIIYDAIEASVAKGGPISGSNFWAWGGEGRAQHPDYHLLRGETAYVGDPPHEPQGWYSVFDNDQSTHDTITAHAARLGVFRKK